MKREIDVRKLEFRDLPRRRRSPHNRCDAAEIVCRGQRVANDPNSRQAGLTKGDLLNHQAARNHPEGMDTLIRLGRARR